MEKSRQIESFFAVSCDLDGEDLDHSKQPFHSFL
jgi:hypothetical protein